MAGVDFEDLTFGESLSVLTTLLIDDVISGEVPRARAREHVEMLITDHANVYLLLDFQHRQRQTAARDAWGAAGNQNALAIVGGPAGPPT